MDRIREYIEIVQRQLNDIEKNEKENIKEAAKILKDTLKQDRIIYVFGSGHSQMFSLEMFYRAGGLVPVNPMLESSVAMTNGTKTSEYERIHEIGNIICEKSGMKEGDCLIVVSHSGRNPMPVDLVMEAKKKGVKIITIVSNDFMSGIESRHRSGKFVKDFADVIIDNHCILGDAVIEIEGMPSKVAGTSTILSVAIIESMIATTIELCVKDEFIPPVWVSGNLDNGDEINMKNYYKFRNRIPYL